MERVNGALLVLPCRVYRLTEYEVPGCRPMERNSKKIEFLTLTSLSLVWRPTLAGGWGLPVSVKERASPGMFLLTVGPELPLGVASMRKPLTVSLSKPLTVSVFVRQLRVKEASFTSEMRTRRGGITSAGRKRSKTTASNRREPAVMTRPNVTFQCGHLSLQRSAGHRVLQSVHVNLVRGVHLWGPNTAES